MPAGKRSNVIDHYDRDAGRFAEFAPTSFSWRHIEQPAYDTHLRLHRSRQRVLDLGCGSGRVIEFLKRRGIPAERITGIDGSEKLLEIARREHPDVTFECQDIRHLDLNERYFPLVTAHMVFQAQDNDDLRATLRHAHAHMVVGGVLFFVATHPLRQSVNDLTKYKLRTWTTVISPWGTEQPNFLRPVSDYVNLVVNAGFCIEAMDELVMPEALKDEYPIEYAQYAQFGAVRLAIKARRT